MLTNNFIQTVSYLQQENSIGSIYQQQTTMASSIRVNPQRQQTQAERIEKKWLVLLKAILSGLKSFNRQLKVDESLIPGCVSLTDWKDHYENYIRLTRMHRYHIEQCQEDVQKFLGEQNALTSKLKQIKLLMQKCQIIIQKKIKKLMQQTFENQVQVIRNQRQDARINPENKYRKNVSNASKSKNIYIQGDKNRKNASSLSKPKEKNDREDKIPKNFSYLSKPKKNVSAQKPMRKNGQLPSKTKIPKSKGTFGTDSNFSFYDKNLERLNLRSQMSSRSILRSQKNKKK